MLLSSFSYLGGSEKFPLSADLRIFSVVPARLAIQVNEQGDRVLGTLKHMWLRGPHEPTAIVHVDGMPSDIQGEVGCRHVRLLTQDEEAEAMAHIASTEKASEDQAGEVPQAG